MAKILLINSFAVRPKSITDTLLDNSLGILYAYLQKQGHTVCIEDIQTIDHYKSINPQWFTKIIRSVTKLYLFPTRTHHFLTQKMLFLCLRLLQKTLSLYHSAYLSWYFNYLIQRAQQERYTLIGIKVWYGNSFIYADRFVKKLKKKLPHIITVAGGPHVNIYKKHILQYSHFDLAIQREGEYALATLLSRLDQQSVLDINSYRTIPNLIWRDTGQNTIIENPCADIDLSQKVIPHYHTLNGKVRIHSIIDGLGCTWNRCSFCSHRSIYPKYVKRDPESVIQEMYQMIQQKISVFRFCSSDTPLPVVRAIAEKILQKNIHVLFSCFQRPNTTVQNNFTTIINDYRLCIKSGLRAIFMGVETAHNDSNEKIFNKGTRDEDIVSTVKAIREAAQQEGKPCLIGLAFIFPVPGIDRSQQASLLEQNIALIKACKPDTCCVTPPLPIYDTPWFYHKERFGFNFDNSYLKNVIKYDYSLYLPRHLWKKLPIHMKQLEYSNMLSLADQFSQCIYHMGIPINLADENLLCALLCTKANNLMDFKDNTLLDVISCNFTYTEQLFTEINRKTNSDYLA